ncbi:MULTISPECIES: hypothetical protein [unclassified Brevundimonas]|uniref:hypothetical protein n=1 Tax=unclassified Brevundimonas TaxID=2622653 RepID=UPI0025C5EFF7|nr:MULTISPECIES: hypothetical protein [unclassified Brevundimonas]
MSGVKHTSGPWEVVRTNERGRQAPDGETLWVYAGNGNGWVGDSYFSVLIGSEKGAEANARLIAAAPELLEAANAALGALTGNMDGDWIGQDPVALLRAAIRRATGEDRSEKGGAL